MMNTRKVLIALMLIVCILQCFGCSAKDNETVVNTSVSDETGVREESSGSADDLLFPEDDAPEGLPQESTSGTTNPDMTNPDITEPAATEPTATEPDTTEPAATEPTGTEPDTTEPAATEPAATEPDTTEPGATEPATTEPEATETQPQVFPGNW